MTKCIFSWLWNAPEKCKTKVPTGDARSEASKGKDSSASPSFCWLQAFFGLWLYNSNLCFSLHVAFSVSSLLFILRTLVIGFRTYQRIQEGKFSSWKIEYCIFLKSYTFPP